MLGIAKGSLYFYFKSKEELLISILKHHCKSVMDEYAQLNGRTDLPPKQLLRDNIALSYSIYDKHKAFISLLMQERFEVNDEIHELLVHTRRRSLFNTYEMMVRVYGEPIKPYACDAAIIFQSLVDGYLGFTVSENKVFEASQLADFIIARMDVIVEELLADRETLIGEAVLAEWGAATHPSGIGKSDVLAEIEQMRGMLPDAGLSEDELADLVSTLDVLAAELEKSEPQPVVIKGMVALIKMVKSPNLKKHVSKLEELLETLL